MNLFDLYKNIPVLVIGGCGFIGSHLVEFLVSLGAQVTVIDNLSTGKRENLNAVYEAISFVEGDITNLDTCIEHSKNKKIVFHLAAYTSVAGSMAEPHTCHRINTLGTLNVLEGARQAGTVDRLVFSSSAAVYGTTQELCNEESATNPMSSYGSSKLLGELLCQEYSSLHHLSTVALRYFNVYGQRQRADTPYAAAMAQFLQKMQENKPITIFGNGKQTRDFVSVDQVVYANLVVGILPAQELPSFQVFNIASGIPLTILELIDRLKVRYPNFNQPISFAPARPGDALRSEANCNKFRYLLDKCDHSYRLPKYHASSL